MSRVSLPPDWTTPARPSVRRPSAARALLGARDRDFAGRMRLHARDAIRVRGPGLRELAEEWNQEHRVDRLG